MADTDFHQYQTIVIPLTEMTEGQTNAPPIYIPELEYTYFAINLIIFLVSIFGNGLALAALLATSSQLYPWFVNLVTADLLKTIICMPYSLFILWRFEVYRTSGPLIPTPPYCRTEGAIFLTCLLVSLLSNVAIALDRVVAISSPIFYSNVQRRIRPFVLVISTWLFVIAIAVVPAIFPDGYMYTDMLPSCNLELHNLFYRIMGASKAKIYTGITYSVLFGIPIIVVCVSCLLVTFKLYKETIIKLKNNYTSERTRERNGRLEHNRQTKSPSVCTTDTNLNVQRDSREEIDRNSQISLVKSGSPCPDYGNKGTRTDSPENSSVYLKHPTVGTEADGDKMEMLHRQVSESCPRKRKSIGGRKRLQKRAGITMALVALTFLGCHICLFIFWALYDVNSNYQNSCFDGTHGWRYGKCVAFNTLVVTLVYLNAPLNVLIYYYRCTYLRLRMAELIQTLYKKCVISALSRTT